jgi:hypothetical protein
LKKTHQGKVNSSLHSTSSRSWNSLELHKNKENTWFVSLTKKKMKHNFNKRKKERKSLGLVVHACNPSYSGGRDQKD